MQKHIYNLLKDLFAKIVLKRPASQIFGRVFNTSLKWNSKALDGLLDENIVTRNGKIVWTSLNKNLYVMLKFTEQPKAPGMTSKRTLLSLKGISCWQVILCWSGWNKRWYSSIYKKMELEMDCLTPRKLFEKVCSYKYQFCTNLWASSSLQRWSRSQVHIMAGQNVKKNSQMCQIPIKMLKQHATPNSNLHNLKIYSSKGRKKLVNDEYVYVASYLLS